MSGRYTYKKKCYLLILLFTIGLLQSCHVKNSVNDELNNKLKFWTGKEIYLPENLDLLVSTNASIQSRLFKSKFKILVYVDSVGCTPCKLNLFKWGMLIDEVSKLNRDVSFLFYISVDNRKIVEDNIRMNNFSYPIFLDMKNRINELNHFSSDQRFHVFLLDKKNKAVIIGNPLDNDKLKKLYFKQILKDQ